MYDITDDFEALLRQAPDTADYYLEKAIARIDYHLGEGYAEKHPELIIAFMNICERDFATASKTVRARGKLEMRERELEE